MPSGIAAAEAHRAPLARSRRMDRRRTPTGRRCRRKNAPFASTSVSAGWPISSRIRTVWPRRIAVRRVVEELQVDLELPIGHVRIDLEHLEAMFLAVDLDCRDLADRDARKIKLVDERVHFECADLVDLPDALARRFRLADVRLEQRELAGDRRRRSSGSPGSSARSRGFCSARRATLHARDLVRAKLLVELLCLREAVRASWCERELGFEIVDLARVVGAGRQQRPLALELARELVDLIFVLEEFAADCSAGLCAV